MPMIGGNTARKNLPIPSENAWPRSVSRNGTGRGLAGAATGNGRVSGEFMISFKLLSLSVTALMVDS